MEKWTKLHARKKFINLAVRLLNTFIPEQKAEFPQTQILEKIYEDLLKVYKVEAACGRFDDTSYQTIKTVKDKNFLRTLQLSKKFLMYLSDNDRYYRAWLGLFLLLAKDHVKALEISDVSSSLNEQWGYDCPEQMNDLFHIRKDLATEVVLANYLTNLVHINLNRGEVCNEQSVDRS